MVSLRLDPLTDRKLALEAKRKGRTKTALARTAVSEWLEEQEDIRVSEQRLKRVAEGKSRTFSMTDVKRALGLSV
jgi:predicted DNA-binding protein